MLLGGSTMFSCSRNASCSIVSAAEREVRLIPSLNLLASVENRLHTFTGEPDLGAADLDDDLGGGRLNDHPLDTLSRG